MDHGNLSSKPDKALTWVGGFFTSSLFVSDFFFFLLDSDSEEDCLFGEELLFNIPVLELSNTGSMKYNLIDK